MKYNPKPPKRGSERLEVIVTDGPGKLQLVFFASVGLHARQLKQGSIGLFAGTVSSFRGRRQLVHPEYEMLPDTNDKPLMTAEIAEQFANELIAVYPASAKLSSWRISQAVDAVLDKLEAGEDPIPAEVREKYDLWPRELAIRAIHRPQDRAELTHAREARSSGTRPSPCRPRWPSGGWRPPRCRRCRGRRSPTGWWPRSTGGCRSRSPRASARSARR